MARLFQLCVRESSLDTSLTDQKLVSQGLVVWIQLLHARHSFQLKEHHDAIAARMLRSVEEMRGTWLRSSWLDVLLLFFRVLLNVVEGDL